MPARHRLLAGLASASALAAAALIVAASGFPSTIAETLGAPTPTSTGPADVEPAPEPAWETTNWWTYEVTLGDGEPQRIAVIVHEVEEDGYHVGTNESRGFLGLPISGAFSHDLNPTFAGEVWRMYDFPLHGGKAWDQEFLGYSVNTTVTAAALDGTDGGEVEGYELEASAYSRTVASYTYHPEAQWFDELDIYDPQNGEQVFHAELVDHGTTWNEAYFVTEPVHEIHLEYPTDPPGEHPFEVPDEYNRARLHLRAVVEAGGVSASVHDGNGDEVAEAEVLANGYQVDTTTVENSPDRWRLSHAGTGAAGITLEVLGVEAITPEQAPPDVGQPSSTPLEGTGADTTIQRDG